MGNKMLSDKPILILFVKFFTFISIVLLLDLAIGNFIADTFTYIANWFISTFIFPKGFAKIFCEDQQITMFFRFDNLLNPKGNFLFVNYDFRSHFFVPNAIFLSLVFASPISNKAKLRLWAIGSIIISLFFVFKLSLLASNQLNNDLILDKNGNLKQLVPYLDTYSKIVRHLNHFFNEATSIELRPILTFLIWGALSFTITDIKSKLFPPKN